MPHSFGTITPEIMRTCEKFNLPECDVAELKEAFNFFDKDDNGYIDKDELKAVMTKLGQCPSDVEISDMINEIDEDGDGRINFDEFVVMMTKHKNDDGESDAMKELHQAFEVFDTNHDGVISRDELIAMMANLGEKVSEHDIDQMIKAVDIDGDGMVNFKEFVQLLSPEYSDTDHCK